MKYFFFTIFFVFLFYQNSIAQSTETEEIVTIDLKDIGYVAGILKKITKDSVIIHNKTLNRLAFPRESVNAILYGFVNGQFNNTPNSSVPYFVQTGMLNGAGNHYYKNYYIFANEFNFGISDNLNLSAGLETLSILLDTDSYIPVLQLGGKIGLMSENNMHLAFSTKFYFNSVGGAMMMSIPFTLGNKRSNFTISPNYIRSDGSGYFGAFANASIELSKKSRLVIDFARIDGETIIAPLLEVVFRNGFTLSLGAFVANGGRTPNISFSIPFGRWKKKYNNFKSGF